MMALPQRAKAFWLASIWIWSAASITIISRFVRSGQVPQARLDESVRRVLRVKFALGLFEHPYVDDAREAEAMLRPENVALARTAAERSLVLLKNSPGPQHGIVAIVSLMCMTSR